MDSILLAVIETVFCFIDIVLLEYYGNILLKKREINHKYKFLMIITVTLLLQLFTNQIYSNYSAIFSLILMVGYILINFKDKWTNSLFTTIGYYVLSGIITLLFTSLATQLTGYSSIHLIAKIEYRLPLVFLIKGSILIVGMMLQGQLNKGSNVLKNSKAILYYLVSSFFVLLIIYEYIYLKRSISTQTLVSVVTFSFIISFFLVFVVMNRYYKIKSEKSETEQKLYEATLKNQLYIQNAKENLESAKMKHDFMNHLITLHTYINQNQSNEALGYIKKLYNSVGLKSYVNSNNTIVNAIFNAKINEYPSIRFNVRHDSGLYQMPHDKLTIILGNALDNAIEATEQCKNTDKSIQVFFSQNEQFMKIFMTNPVEEDVMFDNHLPVSKYIGNHKGIGVQSIVDTVKELSGNVSFQVGDGQFELKILIELQSNQ